MAGTNINNNFNLKQRKPLDERATTVLTINDLEAIKYPHPNLRVFVAGEVNKWHEYKLVNGIYTWVSDGATVISYGDLRDLPSINGKQINADMSLEELDIQPRGNYLTGGALNDYYRKTETLSTEEINFGFPTKDYFTQELGKKISSSVGYGLISDAEKIKINESINSVVLNEAINTRVESDTSETVAVSGKFENVVLYARHEGDENNTPKQVKVSIDALLAGVRQSTIYPSYRTLIGTQNGENSIFTYRGTLIEESAELYIGGMLYPVNIGFSFEGTSVIITGAPVPKSEDVMRLKAIYLT